MSLTLAAKHIESQGRNKDTKLVHMTPDELKALNKLSLDHNGKPLSINPKTGLPEAGFLSSILPTVAGFGLSAISGGAIPMWAIAGGIGLAATALSGGDIGQGIMAGLGAWTGGSLAGNISSLGSQAAQQAGGNLAQKSFTDALTQAGASSTDKFIPSLLKSTSPNVATDIAKAQINSFNAAFNPAQQQAYANAVQLSGGNPDTLAQIVNSAGAANAANVATPISNFTTGLSTAFDTPSALWNMPGAKQNIIGSAMPFVTGGLESILTPRPVAQKEEEKNPFGFKKLSPNFKGSFPTQPNPYYTAQYPDYRARPYGMNDGGLTNIERFKSGGTNYKSLLDNISLMQEGLAGLTPDSTPAPITATDPGYRYSPAANAVGIAEYEKEYEGMSPDQRAYAMMKNIRRKTLKDDLARGLQPVGSLGSIDLDPAVVRDAKLAAQAKQQIVEEAKSGGLMESHLGDYSDGGRLLKGPGDGVSDSIPATIGGKQAARLAEGEFVIPARIVSELGNGSTDAGAKRLYAMMDRIKAKRRKAKDIAADTKAYKLLPA